VSRREFDWPLDLDLDLTRMEIVMRDWLSVIRAAGAEPLVDVAVLLDGARLLAYQCAGITADQNERRESGEQQRRRASDS
jgi:hypothetical protein